MTVEKQPPGVWFACCDQCGDLVELDTDPDDEFVDALDEIKRKGWKLCPPETVRFPTDGGTRRFRVTY